MFCPKCGYKNTEDSLYCKKCGNRLNSIDSQCVKENIEADIKEKCEMCGKEYDGKEKECPFCKRKKLKKRMIPLACACIVGIAILVLGIVIYSEKYGLDREEQKSVQETISAINELSGIDLDSGEKILQAEILYAQLTPKCQNHVTNLNVLKEARRNYNIARAQEAINAIDIIGEITIESEKDIRNAENIYIALSDNQKRLVTNAQQLVDAPYQLKIVRAQGVDEQIDQLGEITINSKQVLNAIRGKYDNLNEDEKNLVQNYERLIQAEAEYDRLCVEHCKNLIDSIGEVTLYSESQIQTARNSYNGLRDDLKAEIDNKQVLFDAQTLYNDLVEEKRIADEQQRIADNTIRAGSSFDVKDSSYGQWSVSVKKIRITDKIVPDNTSGYYMYYSPSNDNEVYIDIALTVKNTGTRSQAVEKIFGNCIVEYGGQTIKKGYNLYASIGSRIMKVYSWDSLGALNSCTIHVAITMPKECRSDGKNIKITLDFGQDEKYIQVR